MIGIFAWSVLYLSCFAVVVAIAWWLADKMDNSTGGAHRVWTVVFSAWVILWVSAVVAVAWQLSEDPAPKTGSDNYPPSEWCSEQYANLAEDASPLYAAALDRACKGGVQ